MNTPPKVSYAVSTDGTRIAYAEFGAGEPVIYLQGVGHITREWQLPEVAAWLTRMGSRMRLIKVDQRNSGLSQRGVPLGPNADDVLAVADHMGLARFALLASGPMGEGALSVAKEHTDRVTKMVMWEFVTSRSWQAASRIRANLAVTSVDEATSAEIIAGTIVGDRFDLLPGWVEVAKVAWSASDFGRTGDSGRAPDPSAEAERAPANPPPDPFAGLEVITCPVLVVVQETGAYGMEDAQRLVSLLPNAKLIVHPYRPLYPPALPSDAPVLAAVEDFLGGPAPARLETLRVPPSAPSSSPTSSPRRPFSPSCATSACARSCANTTP